MPLVVKRVNKAYAGESVARPSEFKHFIKYLSSLPREDPKSTGESNYQAPAMCSSLQFRAKAISLPPTHFWRNTSPSSSPCNLSQPMLSAAHGHSPSPGTIPPLISSSVRSCPVTASTSQPIMSSAPVGDHSVPSGPATIMDES